jgi:hypothetical protein
VRAMVRRDGDVAGYIAEPIESGCRTGLVGGYNVGGLLGGYMSRSGYQAGK